MADSPGLSLPQFDPVSIFDLFRANFATELLVVAVAHLNVFGHLGSGGLDRETLRAKLGLAERPFVVLTTALRAMELLTLGADGKLELTVLARDHLTPGAPWDVSGYVGMAADSPGVREMFERLVTNKPQGHADEQAPVGFIYRQGMPSAMEQEASARRLTLALAGRAKNVAPALAARLPLDDARLLVDVGGGTGIYAIACLQRNPRLRAIVWDRPEVLKVAGEMAEQYGVVDRLELAGGDMFVDPVPAGADCLLLSNVLHDWDVAECRELVGRLAAALPSGGRLLIHDVFLNDALDGPLAIALYSAALFSVTEGRAYSAGEYAAWLTAGGLAPQPIVPTLIHCGVLAGVK